MFSSAFLLCGLAVFSQYALTDQIFHENDKYFETETAVVNEIPYHIILQNVTSGKYFCGGALLNSLYVLTAAQCVYGRTISEIIVHAGAISLDESYNRTTRLVRGKIIYEQYDPQEPWRNDIALLRLRERLIQGERIKAVSLPHEQSIREDTDDVATLTGYGITLEDQKSLSSLMIHYTHLFPREVCKYVYNKIQHDISETQICAFDLFISEERVSDLGGPLIINKEIAGIASSTVTRFLECVIYPPTVFTSVSSYRNWIWEKIFDRADSDRY